jgi:hypothetical protein
MTLGFLQKKAFNLVVVVVPGRRTVIDGRRASEHRCTEIFFVFARGFCVLGLHEWQREMHGAFGKLFRERETQQNERDLPKVKEQRKQENSCHQPLEP